MLSENLKSLRISKGLSQEELAVKLNVVRQTVSKWEKGLSIPDSEMLIRIADELDTSVNVLLGEPVLPDGHSELKAIAAKLELLNEQFAKRSESRRRMWRILFITIDVIAMGALLMDFIPFIHHQIAMNEMQEDLAIIGGSDTPTNIFISSAQVPVGAVIAAVIAIVISAIGAYKTKNK